MNMVRHGLSAGVRVESGKVCGHSRHVGHLVVVVTRESNWRSAPFSHPSVRAGRAGRVPPPTRPPGRNTVEHSGESPESTSGTVPSLLDGLLRQMLDSDVQGVGSDYSAVYNPGYPPDYPCVHECSVRGRVIES